MAIYDFKKKPALTTKEGEKEVLYPSIVYTGKDNHARATRNACLPKYLPGKGSGRPGTFTGMEVSQIEADGRGRAEATNAGVYISKYGFINRVAYTRLTGRLKDTALKDLKEFAKQGIIRRVGWGNQLHFVRAEDEQNGNP